MDISGRWPRLPDLDFGDVVDVVAEDAPSASGLTDRPNRPPTIALEDSDDDLPEIPFPVK